MQLHARISWKAYSLTRVLFGVLCTLYPKKVRRMVEEAYKARNQKHEESKDDMIEMTKIFQFS